MAPALNIIGISYLTNPNKNSILFYTTRGFVMEDQEQNLATLVPAFSSEEAAIEFLESKRWPNGVICPFCQSDKTYRLTPKHGSNSPVRLGVHKCGACRKQFTVRIGTVF